MPYSPLIWITALVIVWELASLPYLTCSQRNAAAKLLTGTRKRDSITPVLASLH